MCISRHVWHKPNITSSPFPTTNTLLLPTTGSATVLQTTMWEVDSIDLLLEGKLVFCSSHPSYQVTLSLAFTSPLYISNIFSF